MRMCFDRRVVIVLGLVALAVLAIEPKLFLGVLPVLAIAVCPLSMLLMMRAMDRSGVGNDPGRGPELARDPRDPEVVQLRHEIDELRARLHARRPPDASSDRAESNG